MSIGSLELVVLFNLPDQGGNSISPSFTHASCFAKAETTTIGGTTGESGGKTVTMDQRSCMIFNCVNLPVLVDHDTSFKITVPPGGSDVPDVPVRQPCDLAHGLRNTYILIRGMVPSGGVMKLALLKPDPSTISPDTTT